MRCSVWLGLRSVLQKSDSWLLRNTEQLRLINHILLYTKYNVRKNNFPFCQQRRSQRLHHPPPLRDPPVTAGSGFARFHPEPAAHAALFKSP